MINLKAYLASIAVVLVTLFVISNPAHAQEGIGDEIVAFLEEASLPNEDVVALYTDIGPNVSLMRDTFNDVIGVDAEGLEETIQEAKRNAPKTESFSEILRFSEDVLAAMKQGQKDNNSDAMVTTLEPYTSHQNWYIQSIAGSLQAFTLLTQSNLLLAAEYANNAMTAIPTELSVNAADARLKASQIMLILYGAQGNPAFMLDAAKIQRTTKREFGQDLVLYDLKTNFVFALNRNRDFQNAAKVAELLLSDERPSTSVAGLAETYMADTFNELGQYSRAFSLAETADAETQHPVIRRRSIKAQIVALAGLGQEIRAREIIKSQDWSIPKDDLLKVTDPENEFIVFAESLMAANRGETDFALALMKRRADILVDQVQSANSSDMSALLSSLENSRGRQAEREGALQREAELRAEQLKQKNRVNRMLWILIGLLTVAFNFLLAFLRYRMKLSGKVQGLQKEALSAEKMKTEFLGVINHELRTPLNGIIGISDAMIHHADDPGLKKQAEAVQESGQVLFNLLDSLITMSTIEGNRLSLEPDETDLSKTLQREAREWETAAHNKGIAFTSHIGPELQSGLIADEKRIRRCVNYLLSNAIRFTHEGRVHLHATGTPNDQGEMNLQIIVADTGQGMSQDVQSRLFKPFLQADAYMTRKYGGAGLSLAIARKLARMMDGDLTVTSREGRGSEFVLTAKLPIAAIASKSQTDADSIANNVTDLMRRDSKALHTQPAPTPQFNILLADPGGLPSRMLRQALQALNGQLTEAGSNRDVINRLDVGEFDAVMINLDHRHINAEILARQIRQLENPGRDIPIIALSDHVELDQQARLTSAGINLILPLSLSAETLSDAITNARRAARAA